MPTLGMASLRSPPMVTSGLSAGTSRIASAAETTGTITMIPPTCWSRCRLTASSIEARSRAATLATLTPYPSCTAAASSA